MAREIDQAHLPEYSGTFSFDTKRLSKVIKLVKPDYDPKDPKTWPLITSAFLEKWLEKPYDGVIMLPPFVAYDRSLVELCVADRKDTEVVVGRDDGAETVRSRFNHYFPFVYNHNGNKRKFEYMHADHYTAWVYGVTGKVPATRTKGKDSPATSADPFDEILELIQDSQHARSKDEATTLKTELASAQKDLTESVKQTIAAEKQQKLLEKELALEQRRTESLLQSNKTLKEEYQKALRSEKGQHNITKSNLKRANRDLGDSNRMWSEASAETIALEARIENLEKTAHARDQELIEIKETSSRNIKAGKEELRKTKIDLNAKEKDLKEAREKADMLQDQIRKIRDELKKGMGSGGQKRKASSDAFGSQNKKVKTEK